MASLSDAREILRQVRKSLRQSLGKYLRELDNLCTNPDIPPATRLQSLKLFLEYSTGGPPQWATAADLQQVRTPDTEEYRQFRAYQLQQFQAWKDSQVTPQPADVSTSQVAVALDVMAVDV